MFKRFSLPFFFICGLCVFGPGFGAMPGQAFAAQDTPRLVVHLLDYLAKDYAGAVGESGNVLSETEFQEQKEFAQTAAKALSEVPAMADDASLSSGMRHLAELIENRAPPAQVIPLARSLQQKAIERAQIDIAPRAWPDLQKAAALFSAQCTSCHGASGAGDGPAGFGLDPRPANFLDAEAMAGASPLGEFHTIRLGVPGTGMPSFASLSDAETWSLAFYVVSLRHRSQDGGPSDSYDAAMLKDAATLSDAELAARIGAEKIAAVRTHSVSSEQTDSLGIARRYLQDAQESYKKADYALAKSEALRAYLEGIEPVEPRLRAASSSLVAELEGAMGGVREGIERRLPDLDQRIDLALATISRADQVLKSQKMDSRLAFLAAVGILLREGFEAALLILSLLTVIRALGVRKAAWWVHGGWIAAIGLGVASWFVLGVLFDVSGAQRELLEGGTSLFAVLILLFLGFWLHKHSEIDRWTRFLKEKVQIAVESRNLFGLAVIAFIAVFREAFETVLFLRVLWFDADQPAKIAMMSGTVMTLFAVIISTWAILRYSARLPVTRLFQISSYIMMGLAFILTGKGLHSLQESGHVSLHSLPLEINWDVLGIHSSVETIAGQALIVAVIALLWSRSKTRRKPGPAH